MLFNILKKIIVEINMLNYLIKAIISQCNNEKWLRFIIIYFKKIISAKLNYQIYNKKLLIIINIFKKQKMYLKESIYLIKILINYKNLLYFIIIKKFNQK